MRPTVFILLCLFIVVYTGRPKRLRSCKDVTSYSTCNLYRNYCNLETYGWKTWMSKYCSKTCGFCRSGGFSHVAITKGPVGKVAKKGETVSFTCAFQGVPKPSVTWTKDGVEIKNNGRFSVIIQQGHTQLKIEQIVQGDAGDYMVTLRNSGATASAWAQLVINTATTPPAMKKAPKGKVAKSGSTVVFTCQFVGEPEPTVTWTKKGVKIENKGRFSITVQEGYTELKIEKVSKTDNGNYMVKLESPAGYAWAWASLIVTGMSAPTSSSATCGVKGSTHTRIVGGVIAAPGDWPWQVTYDWVGNTGNPGHWCGASIISPNWILTAAHCFVSKKPEDYTLTVGDFEIGQEEDHEQKIKIDQIIVHEDYNSKTFDYDLALMKLTNPIRFTSRVRPVCLPHDGMDFATGTNCYVTGWGKLKELGDFPTRLYQAKVPLVDHQNCSTTYAMHHGYTITERMRCAGFGTGGIDACQGDSGGPLVCSRNNRWYLMGAVSWGIGCARAHSYGVYADIANLKPWVLKTMGGS